MEKLKFKNALYAVLYVACFATVCVILCGSVCALVSAFFEDSKDLISILITFGLALFLVWLLAGLVILFNKTVIITYDEVKMCRGNKVIWSIKREDIQECIYNEMKWYDFLFPISTMNAFALQFKLKEKGISKKFCSLSLKQVNKIIETFDYPIREIETVYQQ